jgi:hypothetical protein
MVFLLREIARLPPSFRARGVFSGSSAIMVQVRRENYYWTFIDSFWTMRAKLADIGEWLGLPKLDDKSTDDMTPAELRTYNERDCIILWQAMTRFQDAILDIGGELGITIAATALKTFLRRYMKHPIKNTNKINDYALNGYVASRVEPFRFSCETANYYDINSSFAYSMVGPCPGSMIGYSAGGSARIPDKGTWFADVQLRQCSEYPAVPYRSPSGRIFFPNGRFRTTITSEDYLAGGFEIEKVYSSVSFEERDDLRAYAEDFFRLRQVGGFEGKVYKFALTNLYGKFSEGEEKEALIVNPASCDPDSRMIAPSILVKAVRRRVPHRHVPISAMITARSRRLLLEHIRTASKSGRVYYCDTDSIVCDAFLATCRHGSSRLHEHCDVDGCKELGGLKWEYVVDRGRFVAPKLYAIEKEGGGHEVKAKGFSRAVGLLSPIEREKLPTTRVEREAELKAFVKERVQAGEGERVPLDYETFIKLSQGYAAVIERMMRIPELVRAEGADYTPRQTIAAKALNQELIPKRRPLDDGGSIPWEVKEIWDQ